MAAAIHDTITRYVPLIKARAVGRVDSDIYPILKEFARDIASVSLEGIVSSMREKHVPNKPV